MDDAKSFTRRGALAIGAGALSTSFVARPSLAQTDVYPSREIKVVCAFPPGSGADVWVRFFAEQARPFMKQPLIVDNRPGASGLIATTYAAKAKPDGYTIFIHSPTSLAANYFMFKDKPVDPTQAMVTVAGLLKFSFYLTVAADKPWKDLKELVAYLREKGDKANYATTAPPGQLMGSLFREIMQLKAVEIPYRTSNDTLNDYKSGAVDFGFHDGVFTHAQVRSGALRILGVGSKERMASNPDTPTLHEQGVTGLDVPGFFGVITPAGTPRPVIETLNKVFRDVVATPASQEFIKRSGGDPLSISADDAQKMYLESFREWGRLIGVAKIEPKG